MTDKKAITDNIEKSLNIFGAVVDGLSLNFLGFMQRITTDIKLKNLEKNLQTLNEKVNNSILDGKLPVLIHEDNNLMLSLLEEMSSTYTEVKRECITNLVANMLYEKKHGTFQIYTYQVIFDQFKQMFDPEILLLKEINLNYKDLLRKEIVGNKDILSLNAISKLEQYDLYRLKKLENLVFVKEDFGHGSERDTDEHIYGEYIYNEKYINTFYYKACTLLYETKNDQLG
ncbi:hypothetical protein ABFY48_01880 [Lysinibacillus pakistanensis]|uniref:hypothetical protein n=1 Tax=Lysinibacillus pakistanensis TaxID=759811 RepID=UPI003D2709EA